MSPRTSSGPRMPHENRERGELDVAQHHHCQGIKLGAGKSIGVPMPAVATANAGKATSGHHGNPAVISVLPSKAAFPRLSCASHGTCGRAGCSSGSARSRGRQRTPVNRSACPVTDAWSTRMAPPRKAPPWFTTTKKRCTNF